MSIEDLEKHEEIKFINHQSFITLEKNLEQWKLIYFFTIICRQTIINQQLKIIKNFQTPHHEVKKLIFMKNGKKLISFGWDSIIFIWKEDLYQQWKIYKILEGHTEVVNCITNNQEGNFIISGGDDRMIKFWSQTKDWKCIQTLKVHQKRVLCLSLNFDNSYLISIAEDMQLIIIKIDTNRQWKVHQRIIQFNGCYLSFVTNDKFIFVMDIGEQIAIFEKDDEFNLFKQAKTIYLPFFGGFDIHFQSKFVKNCNLQVLKTGQFLHFIQQTVSGQFYRVQTIKFSSQLCGNCSEDGKLLIIFQEFQRNQQSSIFNQMEIRKRRQRL